MKGFGSLIMCACTLLTGRASAQAFQGAFDENCTVQNDCPVELGMDMAAMTLRFASGETRFNFDVTGSVVRLGLPISSTLTIEPLLSFKFFNGDSVSTAVVGVGVGMPFHVQPTGGRSGLFVRPLVTIHYVNADASGVGKGDAQFAIGAGFGGKFPIANNVSFRLEVVPAYAVESDLFESGFSIGMFVGISIFLLPSPENVEQ